MSKVDPHKALCLAILARRCPRGKALQETVKPGIQPEPHIVVAIHMLS